MTLLHDGLGFLIRFASYVWFMDLQIQPLEALVAGDEFRFGKVHADSLVGHYSTPQAQHH
jgi:hypothetical protein